MFEKSDRGSVYYELVKANYKLEKLRHTISTIVPYVK
jgi:hypothetical protein